MYSIMTTRWLFISKPILEQSISSRVLIMVLPICSGSICLLLLLGQLGSWLRLRLSCGCSMAYAMQLAGFLECSKDHAVLSWGVQALCDFFMAWTIYVISPWLRVRRARTVRRARSCGFTRSLLLKTQNRINSMRPFNNAVNLFVPTIVNAVNLFAHDCVNYTTMCY